MNKPHTPTTHGTWRVIDGKLVDEATLPAPTAEPASEADQEQAPHAPKSRKATTPAE